MQLRDYFDRTYVLNLPSRPDRRREMTQELARVGLTPADGKVEFFDAFKFDHDGGFPTVGARGCFLSHLAILKRARSLNLRNVLVLEDDLTFTPALLAEQHWLTLELSQTDWGVVHLGYRIPRFDTTPETLALGKAIAGARVGTLGRTSFHRIQPAEEVLTTAFYAIHSSIFDRAIACLEAILSRPPGHPDGGPMHIDGAYNTFRRGNPDVPALITLPPLSVERPSRSDVSPGRFDNTPLLRPIVQLARSAKHLLKRPHAAGAAAASPARG